MSTNIAITHLGVSPSCFPCQKGISQQFSAWIHSCCCISFVNISVSQRSSRHHYWSHTMPPASRIPRTERTERRTRPTREKRFCWISRTARRLWPRRLQWRTRPNWPTRTKRVQRGPRCSQPLGEGSHLHQVGELSLSSRNGNQFDLHQKD